MTGDLLRSEGAAGVSAAKPARAQPFSSIAALLHDAATTAHALDNPALASIIDAASQVSRAGDECARSLQEHLRALGSGLRRELALLRQLKQLVHAMSDQEALGASDLEESSQSVCADGSSAPFARNEASTKFARTVAALRRAIELALPEEPVDTEGDFETKTGLRARLETLPEGLDVGWATAHAPIAPQRGFGADRGVLADRRDRSASAPPVMTVYFLSSPFQVLIDDQPITEWPNQKSKSILTYLVSHRERPVPKEALMQAFWAGADQSAARNNLNVAIHGLRKALGVQGSSFPFVLFEDGCYFLNTHLQIWVDAEAFNEHLRRGRDCERGKRREFAAKEYRAAEALFPAGLQVETPSELWLDEMRRFHLKGRSHALDFLSRDALERNDLDTAILYCEKALTLDSCNEEAHRRLIQCYSRRGDIHLAMRQYHMCTEILQRELNVLPSPITIDLGRRIRQRQPI